MDNETLKRLRDRYRLVRACRQTDPTDWRLFHGEMHGMCTVFAKWLNVTESEAHDILMGEKDIPTEERHD
jgi:hypothetical protein